ncbi:NADH-quinone oxidoreductase subunit I [Desulfosporosinus sp.]|uniref:NuoI/complex I 23 kDa subunit family protein n=1 Tax=Desulfosporosinus sp. TaxID=157907 RepID=UPI0025BFEAC1|nr:NADH-quinone oxidoreductase subunit I [Desulfosporosinus sp.]MBC2721153.1 NADH-quinone oxidoreductase subunit I [Desulfosporosinus sp.]MBC2728251.1 NADH-quinone oxidoreductase subunit I [Desulfosporosinus sp.]
MFGKGLLQGLGITLKRMVGPNITEFYPEVKPTLPTKVRSSMGLQPDKCISCNMCVMACPNSVIKLTSEKNESNKKVLTSYHMNVGRCLFCGMCTEVCPTKALTVTQEFENSIFERSDLNWDMLERAKQKGQVK